MKPTPIRLFSRVAMMLLMMMLTATTAWANDAVTYIDENGNEKSIYEYTVLTAEMAAHKLPGGWYVLENSDPNYTDLSITNTLWFNGNVNLILADGADMGVAVEKGDAINVAGKLTVYGQSNQTGTLYAIGSDNGINAENGIVVNGGCVKAYGGDYKYGFNGGENGVDIHLKHYNSYILGSSYREPVTVSGLALHGQDNNGIYEGDLDKAQIENMAYQYQLLEPCYVVKFDKDNNTDPEFLAATFNKEGVAHVAKPEVPTREGYTFLEWVDKPQAESTSGVIRKRFDFTAPVKQNTYVYAKWWKNDPVQYVAYDPDEGKVVTKTVEDYTVLTPWTDVSKGLPAEWYIVVNSNEDEEDDEAVDLRFTKQLDFNSETTHIILMDDAQMVVGDDMNSAIHANVLNIYGQSIGSGKLIVNSDSWAIEAGSFNIYGGIVHAFGKLVGIYSYNTAHLYGGYVYVANGNYGIYVNKGDLILDWTRKDDGYSNGYGLTIYGQALGTGTLNATGTGTNGIGIYTDGTVTINGGTVNATGTGTVGIRSIDGITINRGTVTTTGIMADGDVTINGGKVTATEDPGISSNSGNITLGWTNASDFIKASSYQGSVKIASGKVFAYTSDSGTRTFLGPGEVTLTADEVSAIAGKTLVPQPQFQRVTDVSQLESGKRYLIVAESGGTYYAWSGFRTGIQSGTATTMSVSNGTITSAGDATPFLLVKSDDKWKIIDLKTEKYLGVPENGANQLSESSAFNSDRFLWNISFDNPGKLNVYQMHSDKGQYLKFTYSLALGGVFSIFSQSDQSVISLYKETGEAGNTLILQNGSDNSGAISEAANSTCNVILENHILHKDGNWNTLCLPFNHGKTGPLADATIMELDTEGKYRYDGEKWEIDAANGTQKTGFDAADGTLYLFFKTAESIEAGKPYIIKWDGASGDIDSPIFSNVTVSSATSGVTSSDGKVVFKGTYGPVTWNTETKSILFLGDENKLYFPQPSGDDIPHLGAFRAYFELDPTAHVREFNLNFDEHNETTGIVSTTNFTNFTNKADAAWYTINGVRLSAKPTAKGLYVHGGRKVVIK